MIKGFEKYTADLTPIDKHNAETLAKKLSTRVGSGFAMKNHEIIQWLKSKRRDADYHESKIRKMINYIRLAHLCRRLVATSNGYYVEPDNEKVRDYIESLRDRAGAILAVATALERDITPAPESGDLFGGLSHTGPRDTEH